MSRRRPSRWFAPMVLVAAACLAVGAARGADDAAAKQKQLEQLRAKLAKVQQDQAAALQKRDAVQVQLRASERAIADATRDYQQLDRQVGAAEGQLAGLQRQKAVRQQALDQQKQALALQMQAAYREGEDSQLRLLLDAQDPETVGRLLADYDYVNRARTTRIQAVNQELAALDQVNQRISHQLESLKSLRDGRARMLSELQDRGRSRRRLLATLDAGIKNRGVEMKRLNKDQQAMQSLVNSLRQAMQDVPVELTQGKRFAALRGRLLWPVGGKMLDYYGQPRAGGHLRWEGDLIAAPAGTPVRAIAPGRVVYADWMPHFGLLVIVDHGQGYLSIYAHNQDATHQVGDYVKAGETIASLGDSGGQDQPALYFELRHGNDTLDPRRWCRGRLPGG
ncbi:MAG TPA: peptidoglycan DD-metalloendopeptidase family protein [Gammaproteobacteria bacterium]|nr:peptidoglycan DD-metalloendopeptidase family protein [Gammaproteobacteria bacterium]